VKFTNTTLKFLSKRLAFTLTEMLVVMAIILVLIALLLPSLSYALDKANQAQCINNERQLTNAWLLYVSDYRGALPNANTCPGCWVGSGNSPSAFPVGTLWTYAPRPELYLCPGDTSGHTRSYSLNAYLNGEWVTSGASTYLQIHRPAQTWVFIEEYDNRGYNINSFELCASCNGWIDAPGTFHRYGIHLSFADGHVQYFRWLDPSTQNIACCSSSFGLADLQQLQVYSFPP